MSTRTVSRTSRPSKVSPTRRPSRPADSPPSIPAPLLRALVALAARFKVTSARAPALAELVYLLLARIVELVTIWATPEGEKLRNRAFGFLSPLPPDAPLEDPRLNTEAAVMIARTGEATRARLAHGEVSPEHARARFRALLAERRYVEQLLELTGAAPASTPAPKDDGLFLRATAIGYTDPVNGMLEESACTLELLADSVAPSKGRMGPDPDALAHVLEQHAARLRVAAELHERALEQLREAASWRRVEAAAA